MVKCVISKIKYREEWQKEHLFKGWLCKAPASLISSGRGEAYCKSCRVPLRAQKHDLTKHVKTQMHIKNMESLNVKKQATLLSIGTANVNESLKLAEIKLVLNNAAHGSLKNIDHLCEMLKDIGKGSQLTKLRLHRTKCSKIILNVIAPGMLKELLDDLGEESYSILLDESIDVSTMKYMAYCIRYYSKKQKKIVTDFLGFNEVNEATAEKLFSDFEKFMNGLGLNINNLVGLGTDGAIAAKASEQLPSNIEFLLQNSRNWFAHSSLRLNTYHDLYAKMNAGKKPSKLVQLAPTRWLALAGAVTSNLKQWEELKHYFNLIKDSSSEKSYTAKSLAEVYNDDRNRLHLLFLNEKFGEITTMNLAFQAADADLTKLYSDLRCLLLSLARRIFQPSFLRPLVSDTSDATMLHQADIQTVQNALLKSKQAIDLAVENVDKDAIERQWRLLNTLRFHDINEKFDDNVKPIDFWIAVLDMRNSQGERSFEDLASFALRELSLPISNADIERAFSIMSIIKKHMLKLFDSKMYEVSAKNTVKANTVETADRLVESIDLIRYADDGEDNIYCQI
ncbi:hypothetical protein KQX54_015317 [Cotesia glomerata]|uniref:DUF4371 domain-containing protein n=1 Tax=Cotesia glomerata TaxID=32391 RepID=A0AAV7I094_COTGL|nr:hypothetical protein KQX54_015317 [Cotesia glomerata]